jgi:hypothetical protein
MPGSSNTQFLNALLILHERKCAMRFGVVDLFFLMIFIEVASHNQNKQSLKLFTIRYPQFHRASPNPMRRRRAGVVDLEFSLLIHFF